MRTLAPAVSLKKDSEFRRVYRKGKSLASPRLVLYAMKRYFKENDAREVRVGVSVSGKVGNAVVRNKLRRRLKEIFRLNQDKLRRGMDMVVVARVPAAAAGYAELERDLFYLAGKLGIIAER